MLNYWHPLYLDSLNYVHVQVDSDGSEMGFGSLVQAIFEFIQALTERKKYKAMIRKVLPDVLFYLITYLSIPEYQVLPSLVYFYKNQTK